MTAFKAHDRVVHTASGFAGEVKQAARNDTLLVRFDDAMLDFEWLPAEDFEAEAKPFEAVGAYLKDGIHSVPIPAGVVSMTGAKAEQLKRRTVFVGDRVLHTPDGAIGVIDAIGRASQQAYVAWEIKPANSHLERSWVDLYLLVPARREVIL